MIIAIEKFICLCKYIYFFLLSCPKVVVSTRSGAWIIPNYMKGFATDLYACRGFAKNALEAHLICS